jgi:endonuclease YncB( thermonuclease family)
MGVGAKKKLLDRRLLVALGIPTIFVPGLVLASILGWDWQRDLRKLERSGGFKQSEAIFPKEAVVSKVLDGDTFEIGNGEIVRMIGIDAPDRGQSGSTESAEFLADLIEGEKVQLEYEYYQDDKFGRILADVWAKCTNNVECKDGKRLVNWVMVKKGLARVVTYQDRRKLKYEDLLKSAETKMGVLTTEGER